MRNRFAMLCVIVVSATLLLAQNASCQDDSDRGQSGSDFLFPGQAMPHSEGFEPPYELINVRPSTRTRAHTRAVVQSLPSSFDWTPKLPPARDQGATPTCWDFAMLASFEGAEVNWRNLNPLTVNYSERQVANYYTNDDGVSDRGGNHHMVSSYFVSYGATLDSVVPWTETHSAWDATKPADRIVNRWCYLGNLNTLEDVPTLKAAVMQGPVAVGIASSVLGAWGDWGHKVAPSSTTATISDIHHSVVVVGWDDNKQQTGGGLGAWKIRNSWGADWGLSGYAWVGYGAAALGAWACYFPPGCSEPYPVGKMVPLVNDFGWRSSTWGYSNWHDVYMINKFDLPDNCSGGARLSAVDFGACDSDLTYEIRVYTGFDGTNPSGLLGSQKGTLGDSGIYSIALDEGINITQFSTIYIWLHLRTTQTHAQIIPASSWEKDVPGKCFYAKRETGPWTDMNTNSNRQTFLRGRVSLIQTDARPEWVMYE